MKRFLFSTFLMLICANIFAQTPKGTVLKDNGPLITNTISSGVNFSVLVTPHVNYGFGCGKAAFIRVADDFTISDVKWNIDSIVFYSYQTGATPTTSTFTAYTLRVWNGNPATATVVWGDTTTNLLTNSYFSGIYRSTDTLTSSNTRPIYKNVCTTSGLMLNTGTYWLDWQAAGTLASGPWQPPITIIGQGVTGNGIQFINGGWKNANDSSSTTSVLQQGFPFIIYGTKTVGINETDKEFSFDLFPNPANEKVQLSFNIDKSKEVDILIYNNLGKLIFSQNQGKIAGNQKVSIDISNFSKGLYFISIKAGENTVSKKLLIK